MAQIMPSVSGGLSPFALADKYNARQAAQAQALTEQVGKTGRAYSDAVTADTEALAGLQEAMINNASDLLPIVGPTGVTLLTGELARRNLAGGGPTGLDTSYLSQWSAQELAQRRADELATRGAAAADRFTAGQRIDPVQEAQETGTNIESIPLGPAFERRYSQDGGVLFRTPGGQTIMMDPNRALIQEASGLGQVIGGAGGGPAVPAPVVAQADPTTGSTQPAPPPPPAAAPTTAPVEPRPQDITVNGRRSSDDYSDLAPPAASDVINAAPVADPIATRATELFPEANLRRQSDGSYLATDPVTGEDIQLTVEELQEAIRLEESSNRGNTGG